MAYNNLQEFIQTLDTHNELIRIKEYVNPVLEITEVVDRISKTPHQNKALLFENTKTDFPILINALGSYKRMCLAFQVNSLDQIAHDIQHLLHQIQTPKNSIIDKLKMIPTLKKISDFMPQKIKRKGDCQYHIDLNPNLSKLPVLQCWPKDGGKFITLPIIHTISPQTKTPNVGMYRMQIFDNTTTGMHWHKHKVSAKHFNEYKNNKQKMPVAVALGGDPIYTYAATAPLPENVDEYLLAGFIRKKSVQLVQCITQPDLYVPQDADIVIEGYIDPQEDLRTEGPFGDHTGFYSLQDLYPAFHVTAITHKKNPVFPATIVGIPPQEDAWIGKATERIFLTPIKLTLSPEMIDMDMPIEGVFHNLVIAKIQKDFAGQALKVMNALWGAGQMMFNKILIITDQNQNIQDYLALAKNTLTDFNPNSDLYFSKGPMDVLDHSCSQFAFGGKLCIDLSKKYLEEKDPAFNNIQPLNFNKIHLLKIKDIKSINDDLWTFHQLPILLISIYKHLPNQVKNLHQHLLSNNLTTGFKIIIYFDQEVDIADISTSLWLLANNIDPNRDAFIQTHPQKNTYFASLAIDATIKTKKLDNFHRPWPNVIISNDQTIQAIDKKWHSLNIGNFIPSPSLKFKNLVRSNNAQI